MTGRARWLSLASFGLSCLAGLACLGLAACKTSSTIVYSEPPMVEAGVGAQPRPPALLLPLHRAGIVDLAFIEPIGDLGPCKMDDPAASWRLISADAEGWLRVWQDGRLCAGVLAHRAGVTALVRAPDGAVITAGVDGRVLEWRVGSAGLRQPPAAEGLRQPPAAGGLRQPPAAEGLEIVRELQIQSQPPGPGKVATPRPIVALAADVDRIAFTDGSWVQIWTRAEQPARVWSMQARAFVTGLAFGPGDALGMAMLRDAAMLRGAADHPLAPVPRGADADDLAEARAYAAFQYPGAAADLVEVVGVPAPDAEGKPSGAVLWSVAIEPSRGIDVDIALPLEGLLIYREINSPEQTRVTARSLGDRVQVAVLPQRVALAPGEDSLPLPEHPVLGLADLAVLPGSGGGEPVPMGVLLPWFDALPLGTARELAVERRFWAIGDGLGQIAVGRHDAAAPITWLPAAEPIELSGAAPGRPLLVSASLEPQVRMIVWDLAAGTTRLVVMIPPPEPDPLKPDEPVPPPMFPVELAIDDLGGSLITSLWSFGAQGLGELRRYDLTIADPTAGTMVLERTTTSSGVVLALSGAGKELFAGDLGSLMRMFAAPEWQAQPLQSRGLPLLSQDDHWLAVVSPTRREIYDRRAELQPVVVEREGLPPSEMVAAIANEGTLATVVPIGGGTLERLHPREGELSAIETSGPVTALAWLPASGAAEATSTLVIGQAEGSIDVLEPGATQPRALRPSEGGRVWSLHPIAGSAGAFIEIDEQGASLHRLVDGASLQLVLASPAALRVDARVDISTLSHSSKGLIAIWRPGAGMPACRVFDGSTAGVVAGPDSTLQLEVDAAALIGQFLRGETPSGCDAHQAGVLSPARIEPQPI